MSGKKVYNLRQAGRIFAKKDCIFNYDAIDLPKADIFKQILQTVGLSVCGPKQAYRNNAAGIFPDDSGQRNPRQR